MPQIVSVSPLQPAPSAQKRIERRITIFPAQKVQTVLLPRPSPACAASPVTSGITAGADSCGPSPEETRPRTSWPPNPVIPVRLWRNPNAVLNDATSPVTVTPVCSSPQSTARQPELKCVVEVSAQSVAPSRRDDSATKRSSDAVLVMKRTQNGRTLVTTQSVLGSGTRPAQCLATHAGGLLTQASEVTSIGPSHQNITSTLPDRCGVRVAVDPSKPGLTGPRIAFPKQPTVKITKVQNCAKDGSTLATTETSNATSSSLHGQYPPAVVHISSPNSGHGTIRKLLENMHSAPQSSTGNRLPSNQRVVSVSVKPSICAAQVLKKEPCGMTSAAVQPQVSQEQQDESYGFKILNVCSLARTNESPALSDKVPQVAAESDGGNMKKATTSSKTLEACQEKGGGANKALESKETLGSACNLRAGNSEQTNDIIELCSFQTKKGNSVIASHIVFKPAPSTGHASTNATPCSKADKLKEAIKLFEESVIVQDTGLFSEGEKNILTSLFHRVKSDALTAELEAGNKCPDKPPQCSSKFAIKAEPTSPSCDSVFNAQGNEKLKNLASERESKLVEHPVKVAVKTQPTSADDLVQNLASERESKLVKHSVNVAVKTEPTSADDLVHNVQQEEKSATGTAKRGHGVTASHRPLRRIVITSDMVPMISSDKVKTGIETFLVRNNISNNFSEDEVVKLHWDGKDVSTFHFRDADRDRSPSPLPPPVVPVPQKIKPNILRCSKPATPATSARNEASGAATVTASASGQTTLLKAGTLPEQPKVSTSGPTVPAGYKVVRVKRVADSNQVALTPLGSMSAERGGTSVEKQLCFMPRAIRYIRKTGEVIDQPLEPGQPAVPVVAPIGTKTVPLNQKSAICLTSSTAPVVSSGSVRHVLSAVQTNTQRLRLQPQPAKPMPTVVKTTAVPVTASHIVHLNKEGPNPKSQCSEVGSQKCLGGSVNMPQATPQRPVYPAVCDDTARLLEPEVLLEVSNKVIQVQRLKNTRLDASSSSSSSTSSCCSEDLVPPVQTCKKPVAQGRKRASWESSVLRGYRSRKRRRQGNRQKRPAPPLDVESSKASSEEKNVAILSSNCIDRPCVVSMYRLNDRLMKKGFVNLACTKHKELFALARAPEVRLAPDKVVSVVQPSPCQKASSQEVAITHVSESVPQEMEADSLEDLLKEQMNHLAQLRKKYQQFSS